MLELNLNYILISKLIILKYSMEKFTQSYETQLY